MHLCLVAAPRPLVQRSGRISEPASFGPNHAAACGRRRPASRCQARQPRGKGAKDVPAPEVAVAQQQQDDEEEEGELEDELESESAAAEGGGRPVEIIEDFSNFTPDPPGHRAGFVAIIGRPNAGKSTLLNAILGQQLSIVTPKAQTTRHRILGILSEPDYQVVFLDTPGIIQDRRNKLEEKMMGHVQQAMKDADCLLAIVDASHNPEEALAMIQPGEEWKGPPMAVLLNKTDLLEPGQLEELQAWYQANCRAEVVLPISALQGSNVEGVVKWLVGKIPESPSMYPKDIVSESPERFFVAEIIRKHVFLQYREEIPYSVAVEVSGYKERKKGKDYIEAEIVIEKERQRGILIGKGGSAIKELGTAARAEIEEFLGRPVFLNISVKVRDGWRKDDDELKRLGY